MHVAGELDIATTPQLEWTLSQSQARLVVLDLRELAFIDSCGMHAVISAGIRARQAGRRLVLVRVPANVDRMLMLTGTSDQVEIGDADLVAPPDHAVQRSLVARSLLMADATPRNREPASEECIMAATAHPRSVAEMVPIAHETSDRVVQTMPESATNDRNLQTSGRRSVSP